MAGRDRVVIVGIGDVDLEELFELEEDEDAEELSSEEEGEGESSSEDEPSGEDSEELEGEASLEGPVDIDKGEEGEEMDGSGVSRRVVLICGGISFICLCTIDWLVSILSLLMLLWGSKGPVVSRVEWERFLCDCGCWRMIFNVSILRYSNCRIEEGLLEAIQRQWIGRLCVK